MPMNEHNSCTSSLNRVLSAIKEKGIDDLDIQRIDADLDCINSLLGTNNLQSILLTCILESSFTRAGTSVKQICNLLKCSNIDFLQYSNELDVLIKRRMIQQNTTLTPFSESNGFVVCPKVIEAIKRDEPYVDEPLSGLTAEQFFDKIGRLFIELGDNRLKAEDLKDSLRELVLDNGQLAFCKALNDFGLLDIEPVEFILFLALSNNYVNQGSDSIPKDGILPFIGTMANLRSTMTAIKYGRLIIQRKGLVDFGIDGGMSDTDMLTLSDLAKEKFFTDLDIQLDVRRNCPDLITCDAITVRELYYNEQVAGQVNRLSEILNEENFREIQGRLGASSMRIGFNCLFYGAPGTGKTETVYQLAKESGRDILQIDISQLRSKWVGESEKTVRSIFRYYQWLVRHSKIAPILLFNEADGIFGIRSKMAERSADKMNNTIQNIILQEMEKMEGILIATTNLTENLDSAFERRFLYKIEFSLPEESVRSQIWESMMPFLSMESALALSRQYLLSGGQIENVSRKCAVAYILDGQYPTFEGIEKMCQQETYKKEEQRPRIGF